jgi:hypothetical protein
MGPRNTRKNAKGSRTTEDRQQATENTPVAFHGDEEREFWLRASGTSLEPIWGNAQDDAYASFSDP